MYSRLSNDLKSLHKYHLSKDSFYQYMIENKLFEDAISYLYWVRGINSMLNDVSDSKDGKSENN